MSTRTIIVLLMLASVAAFGQGTVIDVEILNPQGVESTINASGELCIRAATPTARIVFPATFTDASPAREVDLTDDQIRFVAESGQVCRVMGHCWANVLHVTMEYCVDGNYPATTRRRCALCGKQESQKMEDWK